jgi:hypothetical protein
LYTLKRLTLFWILLGSSTLLLPACGSKETVRTQKAPETVLNPEAAAPAPVPVESRSVPVKAYTQKIHTAPKSPAVHPAAATPPPATTAAPTIPEQTPSMETPAPPPHKGGFPWLLAVLAALVLGGTAWYFVSKKRSEEPPSNQPLPPTGGLSPVSGFTGSRGLDGDGTDRKPSFWSKKIF